MIRYTTVKRTWRERLTSLTPWKAKKEIPVFTADEPKPRYVSAEWYAQTMARRQREACATRPADNYQPSSAYFGNTLGSADYSGYQSASESSCSAPSPSPSYDSCSSRDSSSSFSTDTGGSTSSSFD